MKKWAEDLNRHFSKDRWQKNKTKQNKKNSSSNNKKTPKTPEKIFNITIY